MKIKKKLIHFRHKNIPQLSNRLRDIYCYDDLEMVYRIMNYN